MSNEANQLTKSFTVKNKNYDRLVQMKGYEMPYLRMIKLYHKTTTDAYFPIGQFGSRLSKTKPLTEKLIVKQVQAKEGMEEMIAEQNEILNNIDFEGIRTGLINMKTARGKGLMLIKIIEMFQEKTLILTHNIKTLSELKQKFKDFSNTVPGVYYSAKKDIQEITITTHKSFVQNIDMFSGMFGTLIIDEADTNLSKDMIKAITLSDVDAMFGLTGTPYRQELDTNDLTMIFGPLLKVEGQNNNGYNMLPKIFRYMCPSPVCSFEHFQDLYNQLMGDEERTKKQVELIKTTMETRKLGLILVKEIAECKKYYDLLVANGVNSCIVNGTTKELEDDENINKLCSTGGVIVATSGKMSRGVDIPQIDTIYVFYPNKFQGNIVQAVGRGLRVHESKQDVFVYDWIDMPILRGQGNERLRSYRAEYGNIEIKNFTL